MAFQKGQSVIHQLVLLPVSMHENGNGRK